MSESLATLACVGCGAVPPRGEPYPFVCPEAGTGDVEHVLVRCLPEGAGLPTAGTLEDANPFRRYRRQLLSWYRARDGGLDDAALEEMVRALDAEVFAVDGRRFRVTPLEASSELAAAVEGPARVWVKNETGNVSGSHKARHLMGVLLHLEWRRRAGLETAEEAARPLAIASCGNAALAAAVLARAAGRSLDVYVPEDADPRVVRRLEGHGAQVVFCPRREGERGDPSFLRFREALAAGALPFTCQGSENGLTVEGGCTLAYELVEQLGARGATLDRLFVQVGGGALASGVLQGLEEAEHAGLLSTSPRVHAVQTRGGWPLGVAYERLAARIDAALGGEGHADEELSSGGLPARARRADRLRAHWDGEAMREGLRHAAAHRSEYMAPWATTPHSIATGILDDETYDWLAVTRGMLRTGGFPVVADEATLERANVLGRRTTGIPADPTGTSGLAGLLALSAAGVLESEEEAAVLFTGIDRGVEERAPAK